MFRFLFCSSIDDNVEKFRRTPIAMLLDVRRSEEYAVVRIPGSVNLPLEKIKEIDRLSVDRYEPLFIYSADGTRSGQAAAALRAMGYVNAENIGALGDYTGPLEGGGGRAR